jgi:4a-hydroxytetrahydrobiopterin dehydratase
MNDTAGSSDQVTVRAFRESEGTSHWPVLGDGACTFFATESLAASARLVHAIAAIPGVEDHRPDVDIRADGVTVRLVTYTQDYFGMGRRDIELAGRITAAAEELGLAADAVSVQSVGPVIIGAADIKLVMPFWRALLGYEQRTDSPDEDIIDPRGRGPGLWFEQIDERAAGRNRMHIAVWVPYDQAEARVAAAIAAGGRIIFDKAAPAWWTLADAEGNEADISTSMSRDEG